MERDERGEGCSGEDGSWQIRFTRQRLESLRQWAAAPHEQARKGENHNLHLKFELSASKLRRKVMCLLVTIMKKLVATYPVR